MSRHARAIGYIVLPHGGYPDTAADYVYCPTRADAEAQLVDYGYLDNPGVYCYVMVKGDSPESVIESLASSPDPYPDYVIERGPRGGIVWSAA